MQNIVYFICDVHLLIIWELIIIFIFVQIVHSNIETTKYNSKIANEMTLHSVGLHGI